MNHNFTIENYLEKLARFTDDEYGKQIRRRFEDNDGTSELAMLEVPTRLEYEQLRKAVAIMTPQERASADNLADIQIENIARDAGIDPAVFAIFINGYILELKKLKEENKRQKS